MQTLSVLLSVAGALFLIWAVLQQALQVFHRIHHTSSVQHPWGQK